MQATSIIFSDSPILKIEEERIPSVDEILAAPEHEWRRLVQLADGCEAYYERVRTRLQEGTKPKRKRQTRNGRAGRNFNAGQVLSVMEVVQ